MEKENLRRKTMYVRMLRYLLWCGMCTDSSVKYN